MPILEAGWIDTNTQRGFPNALIIHGPTTDVTVGWMVENEEDNIPDVVPTKAFIDTGASESCIDEDIAIQLQLPVVDIIQIAGVGGAQEHNVYAAEVTIPGLEFKQYGRFAGVHLLDGGQQHGVLLGRSFLQTMIMVYDGRRGHVSIAR